MKLNSESITCSKCQRTFTGDGKFLGQHIDVTTLLCMSCSERQYAEWGAEKEQLKEEIKEQDENLEKLKKKIK